MKALATSRSTLLRSFRRALPIRCSLVILALACPALALAGPVGGKVVHGNITITKPNAVTTKIHQSTNKGIINWQGFSIGTPEFVKFHQPGSSSVTLNRVVGGKPSNILGSLSANGKIFLVNKNGVYFGRNATLDVGGLVASTLNIKNQDFINGNYRFTLDPSGLNGAQVINEGVIRAREGGYVVLAGEYAGNTNIIEAYLGEIVLASGSQITLDIAGDQLINVSVDEAALAKMAGVSNTGELMADGGRIILTAKIQGNLLSAAVNNEGLIRARGIEEQNGEIFLAGYDGMVTHSGDIDVSSDTNGGSVAVLGDVVALEHSAVIDASGATGGGIVLVGGDYQGQGDIPTATTTFISSSSTISANATDAGDGGKVIVWADNATYFNGSISARGGANGGDGGFVETSAKRLSVTGEVDAGAPQGAGGEWLLDPYNVDVSAANNNGSFTGTTFNPDEPAGGAVTVSAGSINTSLGTDTTVTINTVPASDTGGEAGNITVSSAITKSAGGGASTIVFNAAGSFSNSAGITSTSGTLNVDINAVTAVSIGAAIDTNGGTFDSAGTTFDNTGGTIDTAGGNVLLAQTGTVTIGAAINAGAGTVDLNSGSTITQTGAGIVTAGLLDTSSDGGTTLSTATNVAEAFTAANTTGGNVTLTNNTATSPLDIQAISNAVGNVTITETDAISVSGAVAGMTVDLNAGTTIADTTGVITATTLLDTSSDGGTVLDNGHIVEAFTAANTTGGNVTLTNNTATSPLDIQAISNAVGNVTITETDAISVSGAVAGMTVDLNAGTTIADTTGVITATTLLDTSSDGGTVLDNGHVAEAFTAANTTGGNVTLTNNTTGGTLDITGISQAGGGDVDITEADAISLSGNIGAGSGSVMLETTGVTKSISDGTPGAGGAGTITAGMLAIRATGSIDLTTDVDGVAAVSSTSGNIRIDNTDAANGLDVTTVDTLVGITSTASDIKITSLTSVDISDDITANGTGKVTIDTSSGTGDIFASGGTISSSNTGTGATTSAITLNASGGIGVGGTVLTDLTGGNGGLDLTTDGAAAAGNITLKETDAMATSRVALATAVSTQTVDLEAASWSVDGTLDTTTDNDNLIMRATTGDIAFGNVGKIDATGNTVELDANGGTIVGHAAPLLNIIADEVKLVADFGIGSFAAPIELQSPLISANSLVNSDVVLENTLGTATEVASLSTTSGGNIQFEQFGNGATNGSVTFDTVTTVPDALPDEAEDNITLRNHGGDVITDTVAAGALVSAGAGSGVTANDSSGLGNGRGDILIEAVTDGGTGNNGSVVVNLGVTTDTATASLIAVGDVTINSVGSITGSGTVTGDTVNLTATDAAATGDGIGISGTPLGVVVTTALSADTTTPNEDIFIDSTADLLVELVTAGTGDVQLFTTGAINDAFNDAPADIVGAMIDLTAQAGGIGLAINTLDIDVGTGPGDGLIADTHDGGSGDQGDIRIDDVDDMRVILITAGDVPLSLADGDVFLSAAGFLDQEAINGAANIIGNTVDLTAGTGGTGAIGTSAIPIEVTAGTTTLKADTTGSNDDINIDGILDTVVDLLNAGTGDVQLRSTGKIDAAVDDNTADIIGKNITLEALVGGIGNTKPLDVDAAIGGSVSADTTASATLGTGTDSNINIDGIGELPVGLLDSGTTDTVIDSSASITDANGSGVNNILANKLTADAAGSISLDTIVVTVDLSTSTAGDIDILEADDIDLLDVDTNDGEVNITSTAGNIIATDVDTSNTNAVANGVTLTATAGGIVVDSIVAGTAATVTLDAQGGDITEANAISATEVKAGELIASASGNIGDLPGGALDVTGAAGSPIETDVAKLTVTTGAGGRASIENTDSAAGGLTIINITPGGVGEGAVYVSNNTDISVTALTLTTNDDLALISTGGSLTLPNSALNVGDGGTGTLRFEAATDGEDIINATNTYTANLLMLSSGTGEDLNVDVNILDVNITDTTVGGAGDLNVTEADTVTIRELDTAEGNIDLFAGDTITIGDAGSSVEVVSAPDNAAMHTVVLESTAGGIVDGVDGDVDVAANSLALIAKMGIGNAGELDTEVRKLAAGNATSGGIFITNDLPGAFPLDLLTIGTVDTLATIGTTGNLSGVTLIDDGAADAGSDIVINNASPANVDDPVANNDGGDITIAAEGTTTDDDLNVNANITATGGTGSIFLYAGDTITTATGTTVSAESTGGVQLWAGTDYAGGTPAIGNAGGNVTMDSISTLSSQDGNIEIRAPGNVAISTVNANSDGGASGDVTIVADFDGVAGGGLVDGTGAISDADVSTAVNITGDDLIASAATGVGGGGIGATTAIDTDVNTLDISNTTGGVINIHEVAAGLGVAINNIDQDDDDDVTVVADAGTITVAAAAAGIVGITADTTVGGGTVVLTAKGANSDVVINHTVKTTGGDVDINADDSVLFGTAGLVDTDGGDVFVTANTDATPGGNSGDVITMANGALIDATGSGGIIDLDALGRITLGGLKTGNTTTAAVTIDTAADVVDGGDAHTDIIANDPGARVTINAATGVGAAAGSGADPAIETQITSLDVTNSTSGDIAIDEIDAVTVFNATQTALGDIDIESLGGTITVDDGGTGAAINTTTGAVLLDASGAGFDVVLKNGIETGIGGAAGDGGNITVRADNDVIFNNDGPTVEDGFIISDGGDVVVTADQDGSGGGTGGEIVMDDGATIDASGSGGTIALTADGDIELGGLITNSIDPLVAVKLKSIAGGVTDGGDTHTDIIANAVGSRVDMETATGVGNATGDGADPAIETQIASLDVINSTSGNIVIDETDTIIVFNATQSAAGNIDIETAGGTITVDNGGVATNVINTTTGDVNLDANGTNSDVVVNDGIASTTSGGVTIAADDSVFFDAPGDITAAGAGNVAVTSNAENPETAGDSGDDIDMANGAVINAGTGTIALTADNPNGGTAGGDIILGQLVTASISDTSVVLTTDGGVFDGGDTGGEDVQSGGRLVIDAVTGVGNAADPGVMPGSGADFPIETAVASLDIDNATSGDIDIDETDAVTIVNATQATAGDIRVTAGGSITVDVVSTPDDAFLTSGGMIIDGAGGNPDITADMLALRAVNGIGSGNALETAVSVVAASNTTSGSIQIDNTLPGLPDLLTIGTVDGLVGVTNAGAGGGSIVITNNSPLTVTDDVVNSQGGPITLTAVNDGGDNDHLTINAEVIASGGAGGIFLNAGTDLIINGTGSGGDTAPQIHNQGTGGIDGDADRDVLLNAGVEVRSTSGPVTFTADDAGTVNGAVITMNDTALVNGGSGTVTMDADGDITLGGILTTDPTDAAVSLTSNSAGIIDGGDTFVDVVAVLGQLNLDAQTGVGIAPSLFAIETTVNRIDATDVVGGININETDTLTLVTVNQITTGNIIVTAGGDIEVLSAVTPDDVYLTSGGMIFDGNGGALNISADQLALRAVNGIGSGNALETAVNVFAALNTTAGNIELDNSIGSLLTIGTVDGLSGVTNSGSGGGSIIITNASPMNVDEDVLNSQGGPINLTAQNDGSNDDHLTINARVIASTGNGDINLNAGTDLIVNDSGSNPDISAAGSGAINAIADRDILLNANVTVQNDTGNITLTANNGAPANDGAITMNDTALATSNSGLIALNAYDDISLGGLATGNGTDTAVTLTSTAGGIVDNGDSLVDVVAATGRLVINAVTGVGAANDIETTVARLVVNNATSGDIDIDETDAVTIVNATQATAGNIRVTAGGSITVDLVTTPNDAFLTAGGAIIDGAGAPPDITAANLALRGVTGIGSGDALETAVSVLAASNTGSGNIEVDNNVGGLLTIGTVDGLSGITNSGAGGHIVITNASPVNVDEDVVDSGGGDITLTATNNGGDDDHLTINARVIASGGSGTINLNAGTDLIVNDSTATPDISAAGGGAINAIADRDVFINANVTIQSGSGTTTITANNAAANDGEINMNDTALATSTSGLIDLNAYDNISLGGLSTGNTTDTAVTLTSDTGAVVDNGDSLVDVTAGGRLVVDAITGIGNTNALETDVASLDLDNATSGNIEINESNAVTIFNAAQATAGDILVTAGGDITVVSVTTPNDVFLTSTGGEIIDGNPAATPDIAATNLTLTALNGIGDVDPDDPLDTAVSTLSFANSNNNVHVINTMASGLTVSGTNGGGTANIEEATGDLNVGDADIVTTSGPVNLITTTADKSINSAAGANIDTSGSGGADVTLTADNMSLAGTINSGTGLVTLQPLNDDQGIQVGAGAVDSAATLGLSDTELANVTSTGGLTIGNDTNDGGITVVGATSPTGVTGGTFTLQQDTGSIDVNATLTALVDTDLITATGNINFGPTGAISTAGNTVNLNAPAGTISGNAAAFTNVTANTVNATAANGIGATNAIELAAAIVDAQTTTGAIGLTNAATATVTVNNLVTGAGAITYDQTGNQSVTVANVITGDGDVLITNGGSTGADIQIGSIAANTTTNTVTVMSSGAIDDATAGDDGATDITAFAVDLDAAEGIGATNALELVAVNISADTTSGDIDFDNAAFAATNVTSATTLGSDVKIDQTGNQSLFLGPVSTPNGDVLVTNSGGTGANVALGGLVSASGTVDINATGAINDDAVDPDGVMALDIFTDILNLIAGTGIGNLGEIEFSANTVSVANGSGDICLAQTNATDVTVLNLSTGDGGNIKYTMNGGGSILFGTVSTTTDGTPDASEDNITLRNNGGGNLTVGTSVTADGMGSVELATLGGGNVILTGTTSAAGDTVTINSSGSINGAGLITASVVDLDAVTGIGNSTPLELATATLIEADTTTGDVNFDNAATAPVNLTSATTTGSDVIVDQEGNQSLTLGTLSTPNGNVLVTNTGGSGATVTVGGISASAIASISSGGAINSVADNGVADVTGATVNLAAATGGIGIGSIVDVSATAEFNANTPDDSAINVDSIGDLPVGLVDAGTGNVTLDATGDIDSVTDDDTADIVGATINLLAAVGGIGNDSVLDVTAGTALNADTVTGDDSNIVIDSIGNLPVGLVDAGTGNVTLDSTGNINDHAADTVVDITGVAINLNATTGIGNTEALEIAGTSISADTATGDIDINNTASAPVTVASLTTGGSDVTFAQTGNQSLNLNLVSAVAGDVTITNQGGTSADVTVGAINADNAAALTAAGAITSNGSSSIQITASAVALDAMENIGSEATPFVTNTPSMTLTGNGGDVFVDNTAFTGNAVLALNGSGTLFGLFSANFGGALSTSGNALSADAIALSAAGNLTLPTGFNVGSGFAPGITGDPAILTFLTDNGISDGNGTSNPNAGFSSGGALDVNVGAQTQGSRYIQFKADTIALSGTTAAPGLLIQLLPSPPANTMGLEASIIGSQGTNITVLDHFAPFTGTTIVLGNNGSNDIVIGENGPVDVGDKNLLFLTEGAVIGNENLSGTGVISVATAADAPDEDAGFAPVTPTEITTVTSDAASAGSDSGQNIENELQSEEDQEESTTANADTTGTSGETTLFGIQDGGVNTTNPGCL